MSVAPGESCAVVGPTGCGKSTTLSLVSGLEPASEGQVPVHGEPVTGIYRRIGFMFRTDAVVPWKSVPDNVAAGPRFRGVPKKDAVDRARDRLRRVGLAGFEDRMPHRLSGGMRKRVALAQTLKDEPESLLMGEPFSALDAQTGRSSRTSCRRCGNSPGPRACSSPTTWRWRSRSPTPCWCSPSARPP